MFCSNCGKQVEVGQAICLNCGFALPNSKKPAESGVHGKFVTTLVLTWFLGAFGAHRFYLGAPKAGLMLGLAIVGIVTSMVGVGVFILLGVGIWALIDFFKILKAGEEGFEALFIPEDSSSSQ
jgi:TM2 domain-containing membrane protein YozV